MTTPDDIEARVLAALNGITPGPWEVDAHHPTIIWLGDCQPGFRIHEHPQAEANAKFVAEARTLIPEMLTEMKALKTEVDRLRRTSHPRALSA